MVKNELRQFADRQLIKPWLQSKLTLRGINIVVERSDELKIVFKCKQLPHSKKDIPRPPNCPFRIRANYSYRSHKWTLIVVNESHNHTLYPISESPLNSHTNSPQLSSYPISSTSSVSSITTTTTNNNNTSNNNNNYYIASSRLPALPLVRTQRNKQSLNELQLELNNSLLRLNCMQSEEDIKSIYLKLLQVLHNEDTSKPVLPSIQETFRYSHPNDNAFMRFS